MKNQEIKAGDYVYIPTESTKALLVEDDVSWLTTTTDVGNSYFTKQGLTDLDDLQPTVFLATPVNKTKIEQFYGIELEDAPLSQLASFANGLDNLLNTYDNLRRTPVANKAVKAKFSTELSNQRHSLIKMFRERSG